MRSHYKFTLYRTCLTILLGVLVSDLLTESIQTIHRDFHEQALSKALPAALENITETSITDTHEYLFIDYVNLDAGLRYESISDSNNQLSEIADTIEHDLKAEAWEVNQAIQNLANEVPLVANKKTVVRVYGGQLRGIQANAVSAWLLGMRDGLPLPGSPLSPMNGVQSLSTGIGFYREDKDSGWLFKLPESWTETGMITLQAVVDPRMAYADPDRANNILNGTFTFNYVPSPCLVFSPVWTCDAPLPSHSTPKFWEMIEGFTNLWPVSETLVIWISEPLKKLQICWWGLIPYPCYGCFNLNEGKDWNTWWTDRDRVLFKLVLRQISILTQPEITKQCQVGSSIHSLGMVHPVSNTGGVLGLGVTTPAWAIFNAAWIKFPSNNSTHNIPLSSWSSRVLAHEITHNLGRQHINCGQLDGTVDNGYEYPACQIDDVGQANHYGFDITSLVPIAPDAASDFMSYKPKPEESSSWLGYWVSNYTYEALMDEFGIQVANDVQNSTAGRQQIQSEDIVSVHNRYGPNLVQRWLSYAYTLVISAFDSTALQHWSRLAAPIWNISRDQSENVTQNTFWV